MRIARHSALVGAIGFVLPAGALGAQSIEGAIERLLSTLPEIISRLSELFELKAGDVILTGTPHGVGPVRTGDELVGTIDGLESLTVKIGGPAA